MKRSNFCNRVAVCLTAVKFMELKGVVSHWTPHGKRLIALSMCEKGKSFIGGALLLRKQGGYEFVVLHLLCQGIEVLGKGYLLLQDYDKYKPQLRRIGHDLDKLLREVEQVSGIHLLTNGVQLEITELSQLYSQHLLRYGSGMDVFIDPKTILSGRVLRRLVAVLRYADRVGALG